jgi:hypothetical protein
MTGDQRNERSGCAPEKGDAPFLQPSFASPLGFNFVFRIVFRTSIRQWKVAGLRIEATASC